MQLSIGIKQYYKIALWVIVIGYLCLAPADEFKKVHITIPYFDKMVHFGLFFILGLLISAKKRYYPFKVSDIWLPSFSALYGGLIELSQYYFTSTRKADWMDWIADLAGLSIGIWVIKILPAKVIRILT